MSVSLSVSVLHTTRPVFVLFVLAWSGSPNRGHNGGGGGVGPSQGTPSSPPTCMHLFVFYVAEWSCPIFCYSRTLFIITAFHFIDRRLALAAIERPDMCSLVNYLRPRHSPDPLSLSLSLSRPQGPGSDSALTKASPKSCPCTYPTLFRRHTLLHTTTIHTPTTRKEHEKRSSRLTLLFWSQLHHPHCHDALQTYAHQTK